LLENAALTGGRFHPKLNITGKPIAHKYCEGKVKRTLKRELKVFEIAKRESQFDLGKGIAASGVVPSVRGVRRAVKGRLASG